MLNDRFDIGNSFELAVTIGKSSMLLVQLVLNEMSEMEPYHFSVQWVVVVRHDSVDHFRHGFHSDVQRATQ